jgi:hypothetical protein
LPEGHATESQVINGLFRVAVSAPVLLATTSAPAEIQHNFCDGSSGNELDTEKEQGVQDL